MTKTSVRDVQHGLGGILDRVENGEEFVVTRRGKVVARILPPKVARRKKLAWPDFTARLARLFPDGPPRGKAASRVLLDDRDERK